MLEGGTGIKEGLKEAKKEILDKRRRGSSFAKNIPLGEVPGESKVTVTTDTDRLIILSFSVLR